MKRAFPYPRAAVSVLIRRNSAELPTSSAVALVKRGNPPKQGEWALPGGAIELGTTTLEQAYLEVEEELGIGRDRLLWCRQALGSRDVIVRDSVDHSIQYHYTIAQLFAELIDNEHTLVAGDDAHDAIWWQSKGDGRGGVYGGDISSSSNTPSPLSLLPAPPAPPAPAVSSTTRTTTTATATTTDITTDVRLVDGTKEIIERLEHLMDSNHNNGVVRLQSPDLPQPLPTTKMTERKCKMDGTQHVYDLERWYWDSCREIAVGRWVAPTGGAYGMESGEYSWGVWGKGVFGDIGVGAYRMHQKDGTLKGYRFDVLNNVNINSQQHVMSFNDLLLDGIVTLSMDGGITKLECVMEDEDEVMHWQNRLSVEQRSVIDTARDVLQNDNSLRALVGQVNHILGTAVTEHREALKALGGFGTDLK